ncbi:Wilms tumor protein 1-interacting-like protein [Oryzias melastigma]|uniref:Wilms tumor protein 1-interacting-like protein n=1 Tax=Oryzias melastigma TaxID=30732 RepID=A0A834CNT6_ORYME|nr:Wilms tumor protein 1-interacting-like protein [Oryzias melastigma]
MEHYQEELGLRAAALMEDLSLYDSFNDGMYSARRNLVINPDLDFSAPAEHQTNGTSVLHQQHHTLENFTAGNKVYNAAPVRPVTCARTVPVDFCTPQREAVYSEESCYSKSEVALALLHRYVRPAPALLPGGAGPPVQHRLHFRRQGAASARQQVQQRLHYQQLQPPLQPGVLPVLPGAEQARQPAVEHQQPARQLGGAGAGALHQPQVQPGSQRGQQRSQPPIQLCKHGQ